MPGAYLCIFSYLEVLSFVSSYRVKIFLPHRILGLKFKIRHFCPIVFTVSFLRTFWNTTMSTHFLFLKIIRPNRVKMDDLPNLNLSFVYSCYPQVLSSSIAFLTSISYLRYTSPARRQPL